MNIELYLMRLRELGVPRGQLESGFEADYGSNAISREAEILDRSAPARLVPPPLEVPMEGCKPKMPKKSEAQRGRLAMARCKPSTRPIYESLTARGMTVARLSEVTGVDRVVITHAIAGYIVSQRTFERCWGLFTAREQSLLRWPELLKVRRSPRAA